MAGASIFAVVLSPPLGTEQLDTLARPIASAGADKLLLCEADDFVTPEIDATHGRGLDAAVARIPPMLILFAPGGAGAALGPPLAARLGGPFAPWCDFLTSDADVPDGAGTGIAATRTSNPGGASDGAVVPAAPGRVQLIRCRPNGRSRRRLDPLDIERSIVAVLNAGQAPPPNGRIQDLEVEVVSSVKARDQVTPLEVERQRDPHGDLQLAPVLVLIGDTDAGIPIVAPHDLSAITPPGTAVARARDVPAAVLAGCCPDILLKVGPSSVHTARSPRTRVVLAAVAPGPADPLVEDVDVLWPFQSSSDLTAAAVAVLLTELAGSITS